MNCPVCREPLIVVERDGIELDFCPFCRGLWFDAGEVALLAEKLGRTLTVAEGASMERAETTEKPRPCPRCDRGMDKVNLGSAPRVLLDRCGAGHGLWFDHGEVGALVGQMPAAPGSHPAAVVQFMGEQFGTGEAAGAAPAAGAATSGEVKS